jgi:hypothetical protein
VPFEIFKKILVQAVPWQAAALDLRNGRATVLALRQMRYEGALRIATHAMNRAKGSTRDLLLFFWGKKWWWLAPMLLTSLALGTCIQLVRP